MAGALEMPERDRRRGRPQPIPGDNAPAQRSLQRRKGGPQAKSQSSPQGSPQGTPTLLGVRIRPRSREEAVVGERQGLVEIRLRAAPVDGAANAALCRFLADRLGVPLRDVVIDCGLNSPYKRIRVHGHDAESLRQALLGQR